MNRSYHPGREPVGGCVSCGRLICSECKVILGGKVYCNPCADALLTETAVSKNLSWFERHLNWTMVLAFPAAFIVCFTAGVIIGAIDPYVSYAAIQTMGFILSSVVFALIWGWALRKKNRSLWWLLLGLFVPFGFIVLLCLENRRQISELPGPQA